MLTAAVIGAAAAAVALVASFFTFRDWVGNNLSSSKYNTRRALQSIPQHRSVADIYL